MQMSFSATIGANESGNGTRIQLKVNIADNSVSLDLNA